KWRCVINPDIAAAVPVERAVRGARFRGGDFLVVVIRVAPVLGALIHTTARPIVPRVRDLLRRRPRQKHRAAHPPIPRPPTIAPRRWLNSLSPVTTATAAASSKKRSGAACATMAKGTTPTRMASSPSTSWLHRSPAEWSAATSVAVQAVIADPVVGVAIAGQEEIEDLEVGLEEIGAATAEVTDTPIVEVTAAVIGTAAAEIAVVT